MPSILFVCTANLFRSPLAAACLVKNIEEENSDGTWIVESAGTWSMVGLSVPKLTRQAARQVGLAGLDRHHTKRIHQEMLNHFDLIIVMEAGHKEAISVEFPCARDRVYLLSEIVDGIPYDILDPADPDVDAYEIARELDRLITTGKEKILQLAASLSAAPLNT